MATKKDLDAARQKLKLKSELLRLRVQIADAQDKAKRIKAQLAGMGGRIRV